MESSRLVIVMGKKPIIAWVVPMHSLFCGRIKGISDRATLWESQCNAADVSFQQCCILLMISKETAIHYSNVVAPL